MRHAALFALLGLAASPAAYAGTVTPFAAGALIVPMDPDWQGDGILDAYGLVYALLLEGVPVSWVIASGKSWDDPDLVDVATYATTEDSSAATARSFAGGPFVVEAAWAARARVVIDAWQAEGWDAVVYSTTDAVDMELSRTLFAAPAIAVFEDGNEDIAWAYLNAAGIPDPDGNPWDAASRANLSDTSLEGADAAVGGDGALFDADGLPAYCHVDAMHVDDEDEGVIAELRAFAEDPLTSALFECRAIETIENAPSGAMLSGGVTSSDLDRSRATWSVSDAAVELFQIAGDWSDAGGSVADFDGTWNAEVETISGDDGADVGYVVATGRLDGDPSHGKVAFVAGHEYATTLPYDDDSEINGIRIFLNSYFTADCVDLASAPVVTLGGVAGAVDADVTVVLDWSNAGAGRARDATLTLTLPAGLAYGSDDGGGAYDAGQHVVTWDLGTLVGGDAGSVSVELDAAGSGTYPLDAELDNRAEHTWFALDWVGTVEVFVDADDDGLSELEEAALGTDPLDADSDDDGLSDGEETRRGTDPLDADSDDDGLSDADELTHGSDPLDPDSDDDGLSDKEETLTDPLDADSDGDGLSDGDEVGRGTDPLDADTDDGGVGDGEEVARGTDPLDPTDDPEPEDVGPGDGGDPQGVPGGEETPDVGPTAPRHGRYIGGGWGCATSPDGGVLAALTGLVLALRRRAGLRRGGG